MSSMTNRGSVDQFHAALRGYLERVQELVTAVNVNVGSAEFHGATVLHNACIQGHDDVVAWLLCVGGDVQSRNVFGKTPLHFAASNEHPRCVHLLLLAGADAAAVCQHGFFPLHSAKTLECAALLLAACPGASSGATSLGFTPLHTITMHGTGEACRLLLDAGCKVDEEDKGRHTPLWYSIRCWQW